MPKQSIQSLLNMDFATFNSLSKEELRKAVTILDSAANKRLKRLEQAGEKTPASTYIMKHGGKFSVKGKDLNALKSEYMRVKNFLTAESSSLRNWRKIKQDVISKLEERRVTLDDEDYDEFFGAYEDLKKSSDIFKSRDMKYLVFQEIDKRMEEGQTREDIVSDIFEKRDEIYEKGKTLENGFAGVSGFFENR